MDQKQAPCHGGKLLLVGTKLQSVRPTWSGQTEKRLCSLAITLLLLHRVQDDLDFPSLGRSWFGEYVIFAELGSPCAGLPSPDTSIFQGLDGCAELPGS